MKCIKKIQAVTVAAAMVCALLVQGCSIFNSYAGLPELPANAESFKTYDSTTGELMCINVGGREYSPYGDLEGRVKDDYVRDCLGYVNDDKNIRVYSLNEDPYDNYLMVISNIRTMLAIALLCFCFFREKRKKLERCAEYLLRFWHW